MSAAQEIARAFARKRGPVSPYRAVVAALAVRPDEWAEVSEATWKGLDGARKRRRLPLLQLAYVGERFYARWSELEQPRSARPAPALSFVGAKLPLGETM